jgi:hypothetical protein
MDGLYDVSPSKKPRPIQTPRLIEPAKYLPPFDKWPEAIQSVIGNYGEEIHGYLGNPDSDSLCLLRKYIEDVYFDKTTTFHEYVDALPELERQCARKLVYGEIFQTVNRKFPEHTLLPISQMNEVYVSSIGAEGSDRVFETPHVDGIFASILNVFFPGTAVLRCIIGIQGNNAIDTIFPLSGNRYTLDTGDFVAFDYNRSIHYIQQSPHTHDGRTRMILKLHYVVFPEYIPVWLGKRIGSIHAAYNACLRGAFLKSQFSRIPQSTNELFSTALTPYGGVENDLRHLISEAINVGTHLYVQIFLLGLFLWRFLA